LTRMRAVLDQQRGQPHQQPVTTDNTRITKLEQELAQARNVLATRENQLRQMQQYLNNFVKKTDFAEVTRQAAALKEDNGRLNEALNQAKNTLSQSERRTNILEEIIEKQKIQLQKYQQQAGNLAEELRNLSEAVRLLSQDFSQQTKQLDTLILQRKSK